MRSFVASILGLSAVLAASVAQAQGPASQGLTETQAPPAATSGSVVLSGPLPLLTIGNTQLIVNAPVIAPDSNVANRTFEGQPMTGREAILAPPPYIDGP